MTAERHYRKAMSRRFYDSVNKIVELIKTALKWQASGGEGPQAGDSPGDVEQTTLRYSSGQQRTTD